LRSDKNKYNCETKWRSLREQEGLWAPGEEAEYLLKKQAKQAALDAKTTTITNLLSHMNQLGTRFASVNRT
jgi:hypothetical protein